MKKRFLALVLCICIAIGAVVSVSSAVSQTNTLISKSYLESVYRQELQVLISGRVGTGLAAVRSAALQALNFVAESYRSQLKPAGENEPDWLVSGDLVAQIGVAKDTITLNVGSSLIWTGGSASFEGVLIDTTSGEETSNGTLAVNHRYVAPQQTVITVTSDNAAWSAEGEWLTSGKNVEEDPVDPPVDPPAPAIVFIDVPEGVWYYDAVYYVAEHGLFQGTGGNAFSPDMTMTRGMLTTVLHRMAGSPEVTYSPVFTDVPDGTWYTTGTVWAGQNGIVSASESGEFKPNDVVTREQIALMLYNYANLFGFDTSGRGDLSGFKDEAGISAWARDAFSWSVSVGLFQGNDLNQLMPSHGATRSQIATLLQRFDIFLKQ